MSASKQNVAAKSSAAQKSVMLKQVRSANGHPPVALATLRALGLGKIGRERSHVLTPSTSGMIHRVQHLVKVSSL